MTNPQSMFFKNTYFLMALLAGAVAAASTAQGATKTPFLVVLDPGHGGSDHGAIHKEGRKSFSEKDATLAIAQEVAEALKRRGIQTILTRNTDRDLPLPERTAIANRLGANVFLSLHMNSHRGDSDAEGVETYILNNSSDKSSRRLADLENSVLQGSPYAQLPEAHVALIVKDLLLDANLTRSKRLACAIQNQVVKSTSQRGQSWRNRGVKQALFHVLLGADMPSALVEMGFMGSLHDRRLLLSPKGKKKVGESIAQAIESFRNSDFTADGRALSVATVSNCKIR